MTDLRAGLRGYWRAHLRRWCRRDGHDDVPGRARGCLAPCPRSGDHQGSATATLRDTDSHTSIVQKHRDASHLARLPHHRDDSADRSAVSLQARELGDDVSQYHLAELTVSSRLPRQEVAGQGERRRAARHRSGQGEALGRRRGRPIPSDRRGGGEAAGCSDSECRDDHGEGGTNHRSTLDRTNALLAHILARFRIVGCGRPRRA